MARWALENYQLGPVHGKEGMSLGGKSSLFLNLWPFGNHLWKELCNDEAEWCIWASCPCFLRWPSRESELPQLSEKLGSIMAVFFFPPLVSQWLNHDAAFRFIFVTVSLTLNFGKLPAFITIMKKKRRSYSRHTDLENYPERPSLLSVFLLSAQRICKHMYSKNNSFLSLEH